MAGETGSGRAETVVVERVAAPLARVFEYALAPEVLTRTIRKRGIVPGVVSYQNTLGTWGQPGAERVVTLGDGGEVVEHILAIDPPRSYSYEIREFRKTAFRFLVGKATGSWRMQEVGGQTEVEWTYAFWPRAGWAAPLLRLFARTAYNGYMRQALRIIKEDIEAGRTVPRAEK